MSASSAQVLWPGTEHMQWVHFVYGGKNKVFFLFHYHYHLLEFCLLRKHHIGAQVGCQGALFYVFGRFQSAGAMVQHTENYWPIMRGLHSHVQVIHVLRWNHLQIFQLVFKNLVFIFRKCWNVYFDAMVGVGITFFFMSQILS